MSTGPEPSRRGRRQVAHDVVDVQVNDAAVAAAGAAANALVLHEEQVADNVRQVAQRLHYQGPLQPDMLEMGVRDQQQRGVQAVLAIGAMLTLLREQCEHSDYEARLARLGFERSLAWRFQQAALKFADASPKVLDAIGSQSKVFELLVLDDEELDAFKSGDTVRGITLDKYATMTVSDARRTLRDQAATLKAKDQLIKDKSARIDELTEALHRRASSEPAEREKAQLDLLRADCLAAETALLRALATIDTTMQEPATEAAELAARHSVDYLVQKLVDACLSRGITVDLAERVSPIWAAPIQEAAQKGKRA